MQDHSIDSALLALRKQITRAGGGGQEHVEALLKQRGVPMPPVGPGKPANATGRFEIRRLLLNVLSDGPKRLKEVVACVAPGLPDVTPHQAYMRTARSLSLMKKRSLVRQEGRVWRLVESQLNA